MPILNGASPWQLDRSNYVTLWHGCTTPDKDSIEKNGIDVTSGKPARDFGRGFYTTTLVQQARHWAWLRFYHPKFRRLTGYQPVVLRFRVKRHDLAGLKNLAFVIGDYSYEDYWSLVQHCRQSTAGAINGHRGPVPDGHGNDWYDLVSGPVAAFWDQRVAMDDSDQFSFHTSSGQNLLQALIDSKNKDDYDWFPVQ